MLDLFGRQRNQLRRYRGPEQGDRDGCDDMLVGKRAWSAPYRPALGVAAIGLTAAVEAVLASRYGTAQAWASVSNLCWIVIWGTCGLVAWRYRPVSLIGPLMLLMAALIAISALQAFAFPPDFPLHRFITAAGIIATNMQLALSGHMFLTYPSGHPASRFMRRFGMVLYAFAIVGSIANLTVYHTFVIGCGDRCGMNMFGFRVGFTFAVVLSATIDACFAVLGFVILVMLARRFRAASNRERRLLRFPLGAAGAAVLLVAASFVGNVFEEGFAPDAVLFAATLLAVTAVPVAFLWGLLRDRLAFAGVGDLVGELGVASMETSHVD